MPDKRFFARSAPLTLGKIAELASAGLPEGVDHSFEIEDVAPLDKAGPSDLSFLDNLKYKDEFINTRAGACLVSPDMAKFTPDNTIPLVTLFPYKAYACIASTFYPAPRPDAGISQHCIVDRTATIGRGCTIEHGVVIGPNVQIGDGCWIEPNAVIGCGVVVGNECRIGANTSLECCIVGNNVRLYPGVRVGQDGFGFA